MKSSTFLRRTIAAAAMMTAQAGAPAAEKTAEALAPASALERLQAGNERFASRTGSEPKPTSRRRLETARHQEPFAVIVACADSRVGPETIFDQTIGDLFVVRVAGNIVDAHALGSIEYAVKKLGTRLIVVVGHQRCGAVGAALDAEDAPGHIGAIVRNLQPAVREARGKPGDLLANAVAINAAMVAAKIRRQADFGPLAPEVAIATGYYHLDTGRIEWAKQ